VSIPWALALPVIAFITIIGPIWVVLHYVTVWKRLKAGELAGGKVAVGRDELRQLHHTAERLEARIAVLETVLDAEWPDWKNR
jgi:phage shock protein B